SAGARGPAPPARGRAVGVARDHAAEPAPGHDPSGHDHADCTAADDRFGDAHDHHDSADDHHHDHDSLHDHDDVVDRSPHDHLHEHDDAGAADDHAAGPDAVRHRGRHGPRHYRRVHGRQPGVAPRPRPHPTSQPH